ncbi:hypothetical protein J7E55_11755 [Bacillus sp. ISL-53]|nr:hypothetical protein [Bacillus sp. ISL-53]
MSRLQMGKSRLFHKLFERQNKPVLLEASAWSCNIFHVNCGSIVKNHQMPINLCASPTFNKETRIIMNRNDGEWQKETEENQSATCLQMAEGHAHCVKEQE